jgi:hypothetical protein
MEKSAAKPIPNLRLRNERERRGWSGNYMVEQIGSDMPTLSSWQYLPDQYG